MHAASAAVLEFKGSTRSRSTSPINRTSYAEYGKVNDLICLEREWKGKPGRINYSGSRRLLLLCEGNFTVFLSHTMATESRTERIYLPKCEIIQWRIVWDCAEILNFGRICAVTCVFGKNERVLINAKILFFFIFIWIGREWYDSMKQIYREN